MTPPPKRGPGRPAVAEPRNVTLLATVTTREAALIRRAVPAGVTLSSWIRAVLVKAAGK